MGPLFAFVAGSGCPFCCPPAWFELLLDIFVYCFGVDDGFTLLSTGWIISMTMLFRLMFMHLEWW